MSIGKKTTPIFILISFVAVTWLFCVFPQIEVNDSLSTEAPTFNIPAVANVSPVMEVISPIQPSIPKPKKKTPISTDGSDPCKDQEANEEAAPGNNKWVLVTGGSGFIGSHLVQRLLKLGYKVRVMDNLATGHIRYMNMLLDDKTHFMFGDILNMKDCEKAVEGVEYIFHLAAMSKVVPSLKDPEMAKFCLETNQLGTWNLLKAAQKYNIKKVVYAASSTYYGNQPTPQNEDMAPDFLNPYAASKYGGEVQMNLFDRLFSVPTGIFISHAHNIVNCRFFMVYGERQPTSGAYAIVTGVFMKQLQLDMALTIEGDGSHSRDFIHAADISEGMILALQKDVRGTVINLGTGKGYSVKEVADIVSKKQVNIAERPNDLVATLADTCRMKETLSFSPKKDFAKEISEMVSKVKENPEARSSIPGWMTTYLQMQLPWLLPSDEKWFDYQMYSGELKNLVKSIETKQLTVFIFDPAIWKLILHSTFTMMKVQSEEKFKYIAACKTANDLQICKSYNLVCYDASKSIRNVAELKDDFILSMKIGQTLLELVDEVHIAKAGLMFIKDIWNHNKLYNISIIANKNEDPISIYMKKTNETSNILKSMIADAETKSLALSLRNSKLNLFEACTDLGKCHNMTSSSSKMIVPFKTEFCHSSLGKSNICEDQTLLFVYPFGCEGDKGMTTILEWMKNNSIWLLTDCHKLSECELIPRWWPLLDVKEYKKGLCEVKENT